MSAETFSLHFAQRKQSTCQSDWLRAVSAKAKLGMAWHGMAWHGMAWLLAWVRSSHARARLLVYAPKRDDDAAVVLVNDLLASAAACVGLWGR